MALQTPSMYASTASIIQLVALLPNNEVIVLVDNLAVNSCFGTIPLRYSWESESLKTSKAEGVRLRIQASQVYLIAKYHENSSKNTSIFLYLLV